MALDVPDQSRWASGQVKGLWAVAGVRFLIHEFTRRCAGGEDEVCVATVVVGYAMLCWLLLCLLQGKACNVSQAQQVRALADYAQQQLGSIDLW